MSQWKEPMFVSGTIPDKMRDLIHEISIRGLDSPEWDQYFERPVKGRVGTREFDALDSSQVPAGVRKLQEDGEWADHLGHPNLYELLYLLPRLLRAVVCVEIGTESGNSTVMIAEALRHSPRSQLWSIDLNGGGAARDKITALGLKERVTFVRADGHEWLKAHQGFRVDFALEDSGHTYKVTRRHLEALDPMMRIGGIIAVHDLNIPDVPRAIREFIDGKRYTLLRSEWGPGFAYLIKGV